MRADFINVVMVAAIILANPESLLSQNIHIYEYPGAKHNCVPFTDGVFEGDLLCWGVLADFNDNSNTAHAVDVEIKITESENFISFCEINVQGCGAYVSLCYCKSKNSNGSFNFIVTRYVNISDSRGTIKAIATDLQENVFESNQQPLPEIRKINERKPDVKPEASKDDYPHEKWFYILGTTTSISVPANIFLLLLIFWLNRNMKKKFKILTKSNEDLEKRIIEALREFKISHEKKEQLEKRIAAVPRDVTEENITGVINISHNRSLLPYMERIHQKTLIHEDNTEPLHNHHNDDIIVDVHEGLLSHTTSSTSV